MFQVAFALSFCVLFPNYLSFNVSPPAAIVKTLVMMAGEIEYENFVYENGDALFSFTGETNFRLSKWNTPNSYAKYLVTNGATNFAGCISGLLGLFETYFKVVL